MALVKFCMFFLISICCVVFSATAEAQLSDHQICSSKCEKYATEGSSDLVKSCQRGCRFFTITTFLSRGKDTSDSLVLDACVHSCSEAYADASLQAACSHGCNEQLLESNKGTTVDDHKIGDEDGTSLLFGTPVMQVRRVVAKVVGSFHILKTSVMTYFLQEDNTLLAVESPPQVMIDVAPSRGFDSPSDVVNEPQGLEDRDRESRLTHSEVLVSGSSDDPSVSRVSLNSSRRYSYLLHLLLLLGVVSLSLLALSYCLAVARHQTKKTMKTANMTVALQQEPLKLVRPEDLTKLSLMEEEEAAPALPSKQDLALAHAKV